MQSQLDQDRARLLQEEVRLPTFRPATARHYFRTDPGHRVSRIRIPGINGSYTQDQGREDGKEPTKAFYQRRYEKQYPPEQRKLHDAVREANNGDHYIQFQHIPNKFEAYLETDSDVLADYIRGLIASGELKHVYEDARVPAPNTPAMPAHRAVAALRLQQAQETATAP